MAALLLAAPTHPPAPIGCGAGVTVRHATPPRPPPLPRCRRHPPQPRWVLSSPTPPQTGIQHRPPSLCTHWGAAPHPHSCPRVLPPPHTPTGVLPPTQFHPSQAGVVPPLPPCPPIPGTFPCLPPSAKGRRWPKAAGNSTVAQAPVSCSSAPPAGHWQHPMVTGVGGGPHTCEKAAGAPCPQGHRPAATSVTGFGVSVVMWELPLGSSQLLLEPCLCSPPECCGSGTPSPSLRGGQGCARPHPLQTELEMSFISYKSFKILHYNLGGREGVVCVMVLLKAWISGLVSPPSTQPWVSPWG